MFLALPDPDPLVSCTDPAPDPPLFSCKDVELTEIMLVK
jgi:hypothetical protein